MNNRVMHTSKKLIGLVSVACAAAVFSAAPAGADFVSPALPSSGPDHAVVGKKYEVEANPIFLCGRYFYYVQRITFGGVSAMVPVESVYAPGRYYLVLEDLCEDGSSLYSLTRIAPPV